MWEVSSLLVREAGHQSLEGMGLQWRRRRLQWLGTQAGGPGSLAGPFPQDQVQETSILPVSMAPGWPAGKAAEDVAGRAPGGAVK